MCVCERISNEEFIEVVLMSVMCVVCRRGICRDETGHREINLRREVVVN
jgi:hypothetical protein